MQYWHRYKSPSGVWIPAYLGTEADCPELCVSACEYRKGVYVPGTRKRGPWIAVNASEPKSEWGFYLAHERGHAACDRIGVQDHWIEGALSHRIIDAIAEEVAPLVQLPSVRKRNKK